MVPETFDKTFVPKTWVHPVVMEKMDGEKEPKIPNSGMLQMKAFVIKQ